MLKMHALKVVWCHIMIKLKLSSLGKQKLERNCKTNGSCLLKGVHQNHAVTWRTTFPKYGLGFLVFLAVVRYLKICFVMSNNLNKALAVVCM